MGLAIDRETFSSDDFAAFDDKLQASLTALRRLLQRPGFGQGQTSLGAELEVYLVDDKGRPSGINQTLLANCNDARFTEELNRFNLEMNLTPVPAQGSPFAAMADEMRAALSLAQAEAEKLNTSIVPIAILPTARQSDFGADAITPLARYKALARRLVEESGHGFNVAIDGPEPIEFHSDQIALEGANTAFQMHLRVNPDRFVDTYNAAMLMTPLVLAISGNSPFLFGHRLWDETRVALFKQSIDVRDVEQFKWRAPARVAFGHGWLRSSPWEPFAAAVAMHPPLIVPMGDEDPLAVVEAGGVPELLELRLQLGTTWPWVRAVYDPAQGGHFRIELRALPAGPTVDDMMASSAFLVGLAVGTADLMPLVLPAMPFRYAEHNFYRAAKRGIDANLVWPSRRQTELKEMSTVEICQLMMPLARKGLAEIGVDDSQIRHWLGIIEERLAVGMTGARWQAAQVAHHEKTMPRESALAAMLKQYQQLNRLGHPVAQWPVV